MNEDQMRSVIEALLFAWSDPLALKDIAKVLEVDEKRVAEVLKEMMDDFNYNKRGIQIIKMNDHYQLATKPEHYDYVQKLLEPKQNKGLTQAALETLAIIAYKQPIPKGEIEGIRGVKCDKAIATLLEKDLIEEKGRLEKTGRPILYGTSLNFLKAFGLNSLKDLPPISEFQLLSEEEEEVKDILFKK
ncbi:SMC-Scp complex subunit ScpB [Alkaliphilus transvaalensis]|uniref:SMC-Scp complex subunit ScpB n=1 Tax=Alkaliphilus transvaalensis TaxID=114628 RepID=UPI000478C930|nr:SMC-Scp complex subunit ScpB [Alkaliphilus transvaalensis]